MKRILAGVLLSIAFVAAAGPAARAGDVTKPYYYLGAGRTLSPLDQQRLTIYQNQLDAELRAQQLQLNQGSLATGGYNANGVAIASPSGPLRPLTNPTASQNLYRTQTELGRVNGLLNASRMNQMLATPPAMVVKKFPPQ
jgi:hypothetical protein